MAKYEIGQEINFTLSRPKHIGDIVRDSISEDEVYYFEITEVNGFNYKGKLIGINGYVKADG